MNKTDAVVQGMVSALLGCERFTKQDFANRWPYHPATFGELLTRAFDIVRNEHGIEFRPGKFGTMQRASYQETLNRSLRQRRAGLKKLERSARRAEVAATVAPADVRQSIERVAQLQRLQLIAATTRSRKRLDAT